MVSRPVNVTIAELCAHYGPQLHLAANISGSKLMFAIAGAESSFGTDCKPRHEPAYDVGGLYASNPPMPNLLARWGSAAAYSYGAWQVLLCSAPTFTPDELTNDPDAAARAFVAHMNGYVLGMRKAQTITQIAETYNAGHFSTNPPPGVLRYTAAVMQYYLNEYLPNAG